MPLEPPVRVLRLMRRIEMGTKLGIRSLRTGTSDSHARALGSRARVREEARPPSPSYLEGMSDKPDLPENFYPDLIVRKNEDGETADIYTTQLTDDQGNLLNRDLKTYKRRLAYDDPLRRTINLRLQAVELLKRTGCSINPMGGQLEGPTREAVEEVLQWFEDNNYG